MSGAAVSSGLADGAAPATVGGVLEEIRAQAIAARGASVAALTRAACPGCRAPMATLATVAIVTFEAFEIAALADTADLPVAAFSATIAAVAVVAVAVHATPRRIFPALTASSCCTC